MRVEPRAEVMTQGCGVCHNSVLVLVKAKEL
jgi:hypothetical protein